MKRTFLVLAALSASVAQAQTAQPMSSIRITETVVNAPVTQEHSPQQAKEQVASQEEQESFNIAPNQQGTSVQVQQVNAPNPQAIKTLPQGRTALKGQKPLPLPGLGVVPGTKPEQKNNVLRVNSDKTEIVRVSGSLTNRISTPFAAPKAIFLNGNVTIHPEGQSLYVSTGDSLEPVSLFVTGSGENDPVISLTLVPTYDLPPQIIVLQLDDNEYSQLSAKNTLTRQDDARSPIYTERIVGVLRQIALDQTPAGFAKGDLPSAALNLGPIVAIPVSRYSGQSFDVYRYRLEALVNYQIELEEASFWQEGVRAVSFFPSAIVGANRSTEVFVVSDKSAIR